MILCAEFDATFFGSEDENETILFPYLVLPFGWRGSPAYFPQMGEAVTRAHQAYISSDEIRVGADFPTSQLFVDDAIFIEPNLGERKEQVVACWEYVCRQLLGSSSINMEKVHLEGSWQESHIILGFDINVDKLTIRLPAAKQMDAWHVISDPMLNPGNRVITMAKIQELRGLINHWSYSCRFWHYVASPVNGLMSFGDSTGTWIRCSNDQVWLVFWNLISFIRSMGERGADWASLFSGRLDQVIPVPKKSRWEEKWSTSGLGYRRCCPRKDWCYQLGNQGIYP